MAARSKYLVIGITCACSSCAVPPKPILHIEGLVSTAMPGCQANGKPPSNIAFTIRVMIPQFLSNAFLTPPAILAPIPVRNVYYQTGATGSAGDQESVGTKLPGPGGVNDRSLFNLDLTALPAPSQKSPQPYARIRLLLQDTTEYSFLSQTYNNSDGSQNTIRGVADGGVTEGTPTQQTLPACIAAQDTDTDSPVPLVQFYVPIYAAPVASGKLLRGFNIGLKPNSMPDTPILIDPKMQNNG